MDRRLTGLIGLARRAGRVVVGTTRVDEAARGGTLALLLVQRGGKQTAVRRLSPKARAAPRLELPRTAGLAGMFGRSNLAVAGVTDSGFAVRILAAAGEPAPPLPLQRDPH